MTRRNVVHLLGSAQPAFTTMVRMVTALARNADPERYAMQACLLAGPGPLVGELEAAGVRVRLVDWPGVRRDPLGARRLWQALRADHVALVHQHHGGRSVRWVARRATGAKIVSQLWATVSETEGSAPPWSHAASADATIAVSQAVARLAGGAHTHVIYPGVDVEAFAAPGAPQGGPIVVGAAGRFVPLKGLTHLLRAFRELSDVPNVRLALAGDGPQRAELEREARELGLGDRVEFLGWESNLAPVFARWSIFVQPSLHDALPMTVLEAMAAGLPVVATSVEGLPEVVIDGETGLLVPPADSGALATAIRTLSLDGDLRSRLGAAARRRVEEHFSVEQMVDATLHVYDALLARNSRQPWRRPSDRPDP